MNDHEKKLDTDVSDREVEKIFNRYEAHFTLNIPQHTKRIRHDISKIGKDWNLYERSVFAKKQTLEEKSFLK